MFTTASPCVRWSLVWALSIMVVFAASRDTRAIDPTKIRQQAEAKSKTTAEQRPSAADQATEVEQQPVPRDRDRPAGDDDANLSRDVSPKVRPPYWHPRHWMLGARVQYLDTGARITRVYRQTPAWRIGLEPRDIIIAIDGYQIGYVNGRLYDLATELNIRAGRSGWVRLLVQNRRNDQLLNVDVRLARFGTESPRERRRNVLPDAEIDQADEVGRERVGVNPNAAATNPKEDGES